MQLSPFEEAFFFALFLAFYFLPLFYIWKIIAGCVGTPRRSVRAPAIFLFLWVLQLPVLLLIGFASHGTPGRLMAIFGWTLFAVYNFGPVFWLWRRFARGKAAIGKRVDNLVAKLDNLEAYSFHIPKMPTASADYAFRWMRGRLEDGLPVSYVVDTERKQVLFETDP
jgi:hypothetical protein